MSSQSTSSQSIVRPLDARSQLEAELAELRLGYICPTITTPRELFDKQFCQYVNRSMAILACHCFVDKHLRSLGRTVAVSLSARNDPYMGIFLGLPYYNRPTPTRTNNALRGSNSFIAGEGNMGAANKTVAAPTMTPKSEIGQMREEYNKRKVGTAAALEEFLGPLPTRELNSTASLSQLLGVVDTRPNRANHDWKHKRKNKK